MTPLKPYLIRAIYDWILDNSMTPYILVDAEKEGVRVPRQYVQDGKIVLNISPTAVRQLLIANDQITFDARFGGTPYFLEIPIPAVVAIYARETGRGMVFDEEEEGPPEPPKSPEGDKKRPSRKGPPHLKVVK